jgi:hypothetical protein
VMSSSQQKADDSGYTFSTSRGTTAKDAAQAQHKTSSGNDMNVVGSVCNRKFMIDVCLQISQAIQLNLYQ